MILYKRKKSENDRNCLLNFRDTFYFCLLYFHMKCDWLCILSCPLMTKLFCFPTEASSKLNHLISTNGAYPNWFYFKEIDTVFNGRCYILHINDELKRFTTLGKF
jgi:hypothetical protein